MTYQRAFEVLLLICGYGVCLFFGWLCVLLLIKIGKDEINLNKLVSEANGDASMSRFQLLIFTMIVAISLFIMVVKNWTFPFVSDGILTLLGISASTYAVSKGIQFSRPETLIPQVDKDRALDTAQQMSNTGAAVEMTPGKVVTTGTPDGDRAQAPTQTSQGSGTDASQQR